MWFISFLKSSIGKKYVMATTGLLLVLFLCTHAAGNLTIYHSSTVFQGYADTLHSHPLIVFFFSLSLLAIFAAHIGFGVYLFYENYQASKSRYAVAASVVEEKNSIAAKTMPYSGLVILLFLLVHIAGFTFKPEGAVISVLVKDLFSGFFYSLFYLVSFCALALHLSHGFWSMLQTFGVNHPRYNSLIGKLTYVVPVIFLVIFSGIPLYFVTGIGANY